MPGGDPVQPVAAPTSRPGRELQIHGSARLGGPPPAAGLVDTVRLAAAPTVLRTGRRLLALLRQLTQARHQGRRLHDHPG